MISVNKAIQLIKENTALLPPVNCSLREAAGLVLAEDVNATASIPPFNQSAMDGYAFRYEDLLRSTEFSISGEVAAGDDAAVSVQPQQAIRIFTGAPVPEGLDTVVMQEKTSVEGNSLLVLDDTLEQGNNVRKKGSEIVENELALKKGTALTPAAVGFLAGVGITSVRVYPKPTAHIIVTGKELQNTGLPLQPGQVYESNSVMLQTALAQLHINHVSVTVTGDNVTEIATAIRKALQQADLVLLSGGVSVGDYDFVIEAATACGVQQVFHKVAQRPGKPLYVGKKESKLVFGLPGNPASVLSCFYNYVVVAIEGLTGRQNLLERKRLPLLSPFSKKIKLTQFLKAHYTTKGAMPLQAQDSFRLSSFSVANGLIVLPEEIRDYAAGETVEVLCLPYL